MDDTYLNYFTNKVNRGRFGQEGYSNNCVKCSTAMVLNIKGFDCTAGTAIHGNLNTACDYWWNGAVLHKEPTENVERRIQTYGNNACGTIGIRYVHGGGHAFNFVTDKSGNIKFVDAQTGRINRSWKEVEKHYGRNLDKSKQIRIYNLTNATPDFRHMAEDNAIEIVSGSTYYPNQHDRWR